MSFVTIDRSCLHARTGRSLRHCDEENGLFALPAYKLPLLLRINWSFRIFFYSRNDRDVRIRRVYGWKTRSASIWGDRCWSRGNGGFDGCSTLVCGWNLTRNGQFYLQFF